MAIDFRELANSMVRSITPYQPGKPVEELERELGITSSIKLASNENPIGPSPFSQAAILEAMTEVHIYPDGSGYELKQTLSQFLSIHPQQITIGNGSENILELIIKSYLHPNAAAIISQYTFLTIPILIQSYGAKIKVVPAKQFGHDIKNMLQAIDEETRMIFLVNPNNPTGTHINTADFHSFIKAVPSHILIVVDEAYLEYARGFDYPNTVALLPQYPNLIIIRTFSKAYGLAGLRLGYAVSSSEIADILNRARLPFNVNMLAIKAGCAALKDEVHIQKSIDINNTGMQMLTEELKKLKINSMPSIGNFITIEVDDAQQCYQQFLLSGIIVRPLNAYQLPKHIRVTIGTEVQNEKFLQKLHKITRA